MIQKPKHRHLLIFSQVLATEEEDDIIPDIADIIDVEVGLFNEFGAPDPNG